MYKQATYVLILVTLAFGCEKGRLDDADVARTLVTREKIYPRTVEYRMYCNSTETARMVHDKGLTELGLVTAQLSHTVDDVGKALVFFTKKAEPYLLETSDTLRSIDVQNIKIAVEQFDQVVDIQYSSDSRRAVVTYAIRMEDITPFAVVLEKPPSTGKQLRQTDFILTSEGWQWDKTIRNAKGGKIY